ncbi:hypothetical protein AMTR_s00217p00020670 [Amborella trichopoda]|uniref:Uncharacterized protein n=1 Tax=Amborella trichopoda TaxID=13333 RepID=W1NZL4_AMBTC|nr:hypothetical protein AMTR_s00217p00020670 [Amborella trichopoda]
MEGYSPDLLKDVVSIGEADIENLKKEEASSMTLKIKSTAVVAKICRESLTTAASPLRAGTDGARNCTIISSS